MFQFFRFMIITQYSDIPYKEIVIEKTALYGDRPTTSDSTILYPTIHSSHDITFKLLLSSYLHCTLFKDEFTRMCCMRGCPS